MMDNYSCIYCTNILSMESALKKHKKLTWRQLLICASLLLFFTILTLCLFRFTHNERQFQHAADELFQQEMIHNTLNMHYTIAHPADYGIYSYEATLPGYVSGSRQTQLMELADQVEFWTKFSDRGLSSDDVYTRRLLVRSLENSLQLQSHAYYEEPLSPASGMQTQLPILLAEYAFREQRDVEDYLCLLSQTGDYYDSLLVYEQEKAAAGLYVSPVTLDKICRQCQQILTAESLAEGNHFLQTTFRERIQSLYDAGGIERDTALSAIRRNDELLYTVLLPAYERLQQGLEQLILQAEADALQRDGSSDRLPRGLAAYPEGQEYYRQLLIAETGSYRSPEELYDLLKNQLMTELNTLHQLLQEHPESILRSTAELCITSFPYTQPEEMLSDLQERMDGSFPSLTAGESLAAKRENIPQVTVKTVSDSLSDYCAPAFYLTPPLDDTTSNVIYINEKNTPDALELYTTLAHEGYPGHLYQSVYSRRYLSGQGANPIRQLLSYSGYQEGWALYVEFMAYDYAAELMQECGQQNAAQYIQAEKHNRSLLLCLYSLLDLMVHYDAATCEQITTVLGNFGIENPTTAQSIYCYIAEEPANYPKYYVSYLEILELQKKARSQWGADYTDLRFHTFLLNMGPSDFNSLSEGLGTIRPKSLD